MCNNNKSSESNCIYDVLKVILILQNNVCGPDTCLDTCDRPALGCEATVLCNTRPVTLYNCSGSLWSFPGDKEAVDCPESSECSSVFRIEKLDSNCATFRVLIPNTDMDTMATQPYLSTESFFTINLNCVCAIKCLNDTYICL